MSTTACRACCCYCCVVALACLASAAQAAAPPALFSRSTLDRLLTEHNACGLPLPPRSARLVRITLEPTSRNEIMPPDHHLALVVGNDGGRCRGWLGDGWAFWVPLDRVTPLTPRPGSGCEYLARLADLDFVFVFAVQLHWLGWTDLARELLRPLPDPSERDCVARLRARAWVYWVGRLDTDRDWREAARRLKPLLAEPTLDTRANRALVRDLEAALVPRDSSPGSLERLIDDLLHQDVPDVGSPYEAGQKSPARRLADMGFEAVPALIEALDDTRLTRAVGAGRRLRVQNLASELLALIAGPASEGGLAGDENNYEDGVLTRAAVMKWWNQARLAGEEAYAAARVFPKKMGEADEHQLAVLAKRHPRHLAAAMRRVLRDVTGQAWVEAGLARAVAHSRLPRHEKVELLTAAAQHPHPLSRLFAVEHLRRLDAAAARKSLAATFLVGFPDRIGSGPESRYLRFVPFVPALDDDLVWKAFEQAVRRGDVKTRMHLLHRLGYVTDLSPAARRRALAFFTAFLGDAAERADDADVCEFRYLRILSVRNLAAMEMATLLDCDLEKRPRSPEEWAKARAAVRAAWDRERQRPPLPTKSE